MWMLLLACTPSSPEVSGGREPPPPSDTADTVDTAGADPPVDEENAGGLDTSDMAGWLFTLTEIHTVDITLDRASWDLLATDPYAWEQGDIVIDGIPMDDVGVRLRGKIGSYRAFNGKPKFKISFNEFVTDQRFYGLEELSLNNAVVDCSYDKEVFGFRVYELAGVPHLRTAYARVTVNGADYGLYILLEVPNDRWLRSHYADPTGNLYDGKYVWYGGYSYTLLDFGDGNDALFQLEEGTDVANADIAAVSAAYTASQGTDSYVATMDTVLDWDDYHRMTAVDQIIGHNDGYSMNTNNYRVYFDPTDGKADLLPWDLDYTLLYDYQWGLSWTNANGNITNACFRDATCYATQRETMSEVLSVFEAEDWTTWLDDIDALTYADTQDDPRRECAATDVQVNRDYLRSWITTRPGELRAFWGL